MFLHWPTHQIASVSRKPCCCMMIFALLFFIFFWVGGAIATDMFASIRRNRDGFGWFALALAPTGAIGVVAFAAMLFLFGVGAVLIFINFLALRQAVTPSPMLGRMTSTMRWLILLPAGPGALFGGWLAEHFGLRATLLFSGAATALLALAAWRQRVIRELHTLPGVDAGLIYAGEDVGSNPQPDR